MATIQDCPRLYEMDFCTPTFCKESKAINDLKKAQTHKKSATRSKKLRQREKNKVFSAKEHGAKLKRNRNFANARLISVQKPLSRSNLNSAGEAFDDLYKYGTAHLRERSFARKASGIAQAPIESLQKFYPAERQKTHERPSNGEVDSPKKNGVLTQNRIAITTMAYPWGISVYTSDASQYEQLSTVLTNKETAVTTAVTTATTDSFDYIHSEESTSQRYITTATEGFPLVEYHTLTNAEKLTVKQSDDYSNTDFTTANRESSPADRSFNSVLTRPSDDSPLIPPILQSLPTIPPSFEIDIPPPVDISAALADVENEYIDPPEDSHSSDISMEDSKVNTIPGLLGLRRPKEVPQNSHFSSTIQQVPSFNVVPPPHAAGVEQRSDVKPNCLPSSDLVEIPSPESGEITHESQSATKVTKIELSTPQLPAITEEMITVIVPESVEEEPLMGVEETTAEKVVSNPGKQSVTYNRSSVLNKRRMVEKQSIFHSYPDQHSRDRGSQRPALKGMIKSAEVEVVGGPGHEDLISLLAISEGGRAAKAAKLSDANSNDEIPVSVEDRALSINEFSRDFKDSEDISYPDNEAPMNTTEIPTPRTTVAFEDLSQYESDSLSEHEQAEREELIKIALAAYEVESNDSTTAALSGAVFTNFFTAMMPMTDSDGTGIETNEEVTPVQDAPVMNSNATTFQPDSDAAKLQSMEHSMKSETSTMATTQQGKKFHSVIPEAPEGKEKRKLPGIKSLSSEFLESLEEQVSPDSSLHDGYGDSAESKKAKVMWYPMESAETKRENKNLSESDIHRWHSNLQIEGGPTSRSISQTKDGIFKVDEIFGDMVDSSENSAENATYDENQDDTYETTGIPFAQPSTMNSDEIWGSLMTNDRTPPQYLVTATDTMKQENSSSKTLTNLEETKDAKAEENYQDNVATLLEKNRTEFEDITVRGKNHPGQDLSHKTEISVSTTQQTSAKSGSYERMALMHPQTASMFMDPSADRITTSQKLPSQRGSLENNSGESYDDISSSRIIQNNSTSSLADQYAPTDFVIASRVSLPSVEINKYSEIYVEDEDSSHDIGTDDDNDRDGFEDEFPEDTKPDNNSTKERQVDIISTPSTQPPQQDATSAITENDIVRPFQEAESMEQPQVSDGQIAGEVVTSTETSDTGDSGEDYNTPCTYVSRRCCRVHRTNCPPGSSLQPVVRWYRKGNETSCRPYNYPFCSPEIEKIDKPIKYEENCVDLCFSVSEKGDNALIDQYPVAALL
ncbi:hypothetical protein AB6A40_001975 [Gnathostoma spinigerum]|uniref:BPTI/Kunitz inhibitor domain-containing protein n=1 Tax=Gnathostoma spinigerum TaxID=75299 RepID=A0ABD6ED16_9BILA